MTVENRHALSERLAPASCPLSGSNGQTDASAEVLVYRAKEQDSRSITSQTADKQCVQSQASYGAMSKTNMCTVDHSELLCK